MPFDSPLETARKRARELGGCPVWALEDFYTDHWDFETLCSDFGCEECVAGPEDMGPTEPWATDAAAQFADIPF